MFSPRKPTELIKNGEIQLYPYIIKMHMKNYFFKKYEITKILKQQ